MAMNDISLPVLSSSIQMTPHKYPKRASCVLSTDKTFTCTPIGLSRNRIASEGDYLGNATQETKPKITLSLEKPSGFQNHRMTLSNVITNYHTESNQPNIIHTTAYSNRYSMFNSHNNQPNTAFRNSIAVTSPNRMAPNAFQTPPNIHSKPIKGESSLFRRVSTKYIERIEGPFEVNEDDKIFNELKKKKKSPRKPKVIDKTPKNVNMKILK